MATDPVCFAKVDENKTPFKTEYRDHSYYFDSEHCQDVFERDPNEYVGNIEQEDYGDKG